jgi:hypothetical protein
MFGVLGNQFTLLTFLLFVAGAVCSSLTAVIRVGIFMRKNKENQKVFAVKYLQNPSVINLYN